MSSWYISKKDKLKALKLLEIEKAKEREELKNGSKFVKDETKIRALILKTK